MDTLIAETNVTDTNPIDSGPFNVSPQATTHTVAVGGSAQGSIELQADLGAGMQTYTTVAKGATMQLITLELTGPPQNLRFTPSAGTGTLIAKLSSQGRV